MNGTGSSLKADDKVLSALASGAIPTAEPATNPGLDFSFSLFVRGRGILPAKG